MRYVKELETCKLLDQQKVKIMKKDRLEQCKEAGANPEKYDCLTLGRDIRDLFAEVRRLEKVADSQAEQILANHIILDETKVEQLSDEVRPQMEECPYMPGHFCNQRKYCTDGVFRPECIMWAVRMLDQDLKQSHEFLRREGIQMACHVLLHAHERMFKNKEDECSGSLRDKVIAEIEHMREQGKDWHDVGWEFLINDIKPKEELVLCDTLLTDKIRNLYTLVIGEIAFLHDNISKYDPSIMNLSNNEFWEAVEDKRVEPIVIDNCGKINVLKVIKREIETLLPELRKA